MLSFPKYPSYNIFPMHNLIIFSLVSFFQDMSSEMIFPILAIMIGQMNMPFYMGLMEAIAELTSNILKLISGLLYDRFRRAKPIVIAGYSISTLGKAIYPFATSGMHIVVGRFIDRIGKGIRTTPRDALLSEGLPAEKQGMAFGIHRFSDTLGAIAGPLILLILLPHFSERTILLIALIPAVIAISLLFLVKDTLIRERKRFSIAFREIPAGFFLFIGLMSMGAISVGFYLLKGHEGKVIALNYMLFNIAYALSSIIGGRLYDRFHRLVYTLPVFLLLPSGVMVAGGNLLLATILYGIFFGLMETLPKAHLGRRKEMKGTLFGTYFLTVGISMFIGNLIAGSLFGQANATGAFYFSMFMALLSLLSIPFLIGKDELL